MLDENKQDIKIKEIESKTLLRPAKKIDSWFLASYGMNIYRGCQHACIYCDGRTEKYQVEGEFGKQTTVKINAHDLLASELDTLFANHKNLSGLIMIGGGVGDSYQQIENDYKLTRQILEIIGKYKAPIHLLTKSTLVLRDMDIIKKINKHSKAILSMSFSSVDDQISKLFEPGVPPPSERLQALEKYKKEGLACGMYLMPTIPYITDTPQQIEKCFKEASKIGLDFLVYAGLTLKKGRQKQFFYDVLADHYPEFIDDYKDLYAEENSWGSPQRDYMKSYSQFLIQLSRKYMLPLRFPLDLVSNYVNPKDRVIVTLEQIDYLRKLMGQRSSFSYTARNISQIKEELYQMRFCLQSIKGVGPVTERIIQDILQNGCSSYYQKLLYGK